MALNAETRSTEQESLSRRGFLSGLGAFGAAAVAAPALLRPSAADAQSDDLPYQIEDVRHMRMSHPVVQVGAAHRSRSGQVIALYAPDFDALEEIWPEVVQAASRSVTSGRSALTRIIISTGPARVETYAGGNITSSIDLAPLLGTETMERLSGPLRGLLARDYQDIVIPRGLAVSSGDQPVPTS